MPALTAALSSLPVESVDVLSIGTLEAHGARRGLTEKGAFCSCSCSCSCSCGCSCGCSCCSCSCG
jgi:hypothetical protein